jgi:hypothetical protein
MLKKMALSTACGIPVARLEPQLQIARVRVLAQQLLQTGARQLTTSRLQHLVA